MLTSRRMLSIAVILAVVFFQLAAPVRTLADDGSPTEETPVAVITDEPSGEVVPTEEAPEVDPTEEAPVADPNEEGPGTDPTEEAPVADPNEEGPGTDPTEEAPVADPTEEVPGADPTEEPAPDVVDEELPAEEPAPPVVADVVVLDENGNEITSPADATETIAESDPVWCPEGHVPGDAECTPAQPTISDLLAYLQANSGAYNGNGTIYFMTGTYTGPETSIVIDNSVLPDLGTLVLFGGWDLGGTDTNTGTTTFLVPLQVLWDAAVTLIDLIFDLPTGSTDPGVFVNTDGDITVDNVVVTGGSSGAELINYSGTGNVTVTDSEFSGNTNYGLLIYSSGIVSLGNVVASGNNTGIFIDNSTGTGDVLLNTIFANSNGWTGADIRSAGNITLQTVIAGDNIVGVHLQATAGTGNIFVEDSDFVGNDDIGIKAITGAGDITLDNVNTDSLGESGTFGAWLKTYGGGTITIIGGSFNNADTGLFIVGTSDVILNGVTANGNAGDGVVVESGWVFGCFGPDGINVDVTGGTFQDNGGYGFAVYPGPNGTATLAGTMTFLDNGSGDYNVDLTRTCVPPPPEDEKPVKPYDIVDITGDGSDPVNVDCENFAGVILVLPDGTHIQLTCPVDEEASVVDVPVDGLPGDPPAGVDVIGGVDITIGDSTLLPEGGSILLSFPIPAGMEGKHFSIMFWDPTAKDGVGAWIELPMMQFGGQVFPLHPQTPEDGMLILGGVYQSGNCVCVKVNFTGTFILVAR